MGLLKNFLKRKKEKEKKEKEIFSVLPNFKNLDEIKYIMKEDFNINDIVYKIDSASTENLPPHASEFLSNNKQFRIQRINESGKIDLGCFKINDNGGRVAFYFSSNRFTKNIHNTKTSPFNYNNDDYNFDIDWDD